MLGGQAPAGQQAKPQQQRSAAGRRHRMRRRFAQQRSLPPLGHDQSDRIGQQRLRKLQVDGEVKPVTPGAVFRPFEIAQEVARAGFRLDDDEFAARRQRQYVGPPAIGQ